MDISAARQHQALIEGIVKDKLDVDPQDFSFHPFVSSNNNYVYCIDISTVREKSSVSRAYCTTLPFTSPIAADVTKLILRISKDNVSLVDSVRVRNEVASLSLGREALAPLGDLVPRVYSWADEPSDLTWILEECKEGIELSPTAFAILDQQTEQSIIAQVAMIAKHFQNYSLPVQLTYGGVTFDDNGILASTKTTLPCGGPFSSYADFLRSMCEWQLAAADRNARVDGWKSIPGLSGRIQAFFDQGLERVLENIIVDKPCLVHGDLSLTNFLFDPATYRITAVLNFDFAHIGHPVSEFLFSFLDFNGLLTSVAEPEGDLHVLQMKGFPDDVTNLSDEIQLAKTWDHALRDIGAKRPSTIPGAETAANIWWFSQELCQAFWSIDRWLANKTEAKLAEIKAHGAETLDKYLSVWGF